MLAAPPFNLLSTLNDVDDAIDANADIAEKILEFGLKWFGLSSNPRKDSPHYWHDTATANDHGKAHTTLRQFYRDWSAEGSHEINSITRTILSDLSQHLLSPTSSSPSPTVLLPGAGLARLLLTLTLHGYNAQGNELSYHQLLASNWILNHIPPPTPTGESTQYPLYPFSATFTNTTTRAAQLLRVLIPDIHPSTTIAQTLAAGKKVGDMAMVAGDFVTVYTLPEHKDAFDAVITVFFIDTAPNVIRYVETVRHCLKEGGTWINIGPLLWHFDDGISGHQQRAGRRAADTSTHSRSRRESSSAVTTGSQDDNEGDDENEDEDASTPEATHHPHLPTAAYQAAGSISLTLTETLSLLTHHSFRTLHSSTLTHTDGSVAELGYIQDPESMLQSRYRCAHWVVRKEEDPKSDDTASAR